MTHKWVWWVHNPRRMGGPLRLREGEDIVSGPQSALLAT